MSYFSIHKAFLIFVSREGKQGFRYNIQNILCILFKRERILLFNLNGIQYRLADTTEEKDMRSREVINNRDGIWDGLTFLLLL
jgi:hypothetical protein